MKQHPFSYNISNDYVVHGDRYVPEDQNVKSLVFVVHGMSEYRRDYEDLALRLVDQGHAVVLFDLRGHGDSLVQKQRGFFWFNEGIDRQLDDMSYIFAMQRKACPNVPNVLLGHSLGSLLARAYVKRNPSEFSALLLMGSPAWSKRIPWVKALTGVISFFAPLMPARFVEKEMIKSFSKHLDGLKLPWRWLASNETRAEAFYQDPHCAFPFTYRGMYDVFSLMREVYRSKHWMVTQRQLPILFLTGTEDGCADVVGGGLKAAVGTLREQGYENVKEMLYQGCRHQLLFEVEANRVIEDIGRFVDQVVEDKLAIRPEQPSGVKSEA